MAVKGQTTGDGIFSYWKVIDYSTFVLIIVNPSENGSISMNLKYSCLVEFHCHTMASKDSLTKPKDLIATARRRGIDRLIITDHNTTAGAMIAKDLDPELVIVGEEIMTTKGEILAAYVAEEIPAGLSPQEVLKHLRDQGAFISVSHPFDSMRAGGWKESDLLEILPFVDAIEV
jgi:predicted metal-dependent phosphoesterase TrpH